MLAQGSELVKEGVAVGTVLHMSMAASVVQCLAAATLDPIGASTQALRTHGGVSSYHRLLCARAAGVSHGKQRTSLDGRSSATLIYLPPPNASVFMQQRALSAALILANRTERALSLPRIGFREGGRSMPLCELLDLSRVPAPPRGPAVIASVSHSTLEAACTRPLSRTAIIAAPSTTLVCGRFEELAATRMGAPHVGACAYEGSMRDGGRRARERACRAGAAASGAVAPKEVLSRHARPWVSQRMNALPSSVLNMLAALAREGSGAGAVASVHAAKAVEMPSLTQRESKARGKPSSKAIKKGLVGRMRGQKY